MFTDKSLILCTESRHESTETGSETRKMELFMLQVFLLLMFL